MKENLPVRKNTRLKDYNYAEEGMYFITICTKNRLELLGQIKDEDENSIELTKEGKITEQYLIEIENIFDNISIDEYIIMPNHIHMIILINNTSNISISRIIKQYKMCVSKKLGYSIWQKLYYDHVIRTEKEYLAVKQYIRNNAINWKYDKYF